MLKRVEKPSFQIQRYDSGSPLQSAFVFLETKVNFLLVANCDYFVFMQFKESQEKDDSFSVCAQKGYAGRYLLLMHYYEYR